MRIYLYSALRIMGFLSEGFDPGGIAKGASHRAGNWGVEKSGQPFDSFDYTQDRSAQDKRTVAG